jgi:hypothetical protein
MDSRRVNRPNPRCQQPSPAKNLVWNRTLRHGNPNVPEMWNLVHIRVIAESVEVWWTQHTDGPRPHVDPLRRVHHEAGGGTDWAASGKVTLPGPANFPTADPVKMVPAP